MTETRKLAAIQVADVVGYSRLAGAHVNLDPRRAIETDLEIPFWRSNRPKLRGFLSTRKPRWFAEKRGGVSRISCEKRSDAANVKVKLTALTVNRYLRVSLRFHSLSARKRAMVVTCSG